jgi:thiamine-phosphate pyrophosphorylase
VDADRGFAPTPWAPQVYVVTDRHATAGRDLVGVVGAALAALRDFPAARVAVQLREKDLPGGVLLEMALRLRAVTRAAGARLFVNDRIDVALASGADGVHLGEAGLAVADVRAVAPAVDLAVSSHDRPGVEVAAAHRVSFAVFGPVFDTPSKRGLLTPRGVQTLEMVCEYPVPVVAIGGIDASNTNDCIRSGASGVACIRHVMSAPDPEAALRSLLSVIQGSKPACVS